MLKPNSYRNFKGQALSEGAAAIVFIIPLVLLMVYFAWETNQYLFIQNMLNEAARNGARGCLLAYNWPPVQVTTIPTYPQGNTIDPPEAGSSYSSTQPVVYPGNGSASNPGPSTTQPTQPNEAWSRIRIANIVTSNKQFTASYVAPLSGNSNSRNSNDPNAALIPGSVTVTVQAPNGIWPSPDPLGFGKHITLQASYTYPL